MQATSQLSPAVRARLQQIGGELLLRSTLAEGTMIEIRMEGMRAYQPPSLAGGRLEEFWKSGEL